MIVIRRNKTCEPLSVIPVGGDCEEKHETIFKLHPSLKLNFNVYFPVLRSNTIVASKKGRRKTEATTLHAATRVK